MNKRFLTILLSILSLQMIHAGEVCDQPDVTVARDTLVQASKAKGLTIRTYDSSVAITVKDIDDTGENFYYDTTGVQSGNDNQTTVTSLKDVTDVSIVEIGGKEVEVMFAGGATTPNSFTFEIPDPENRTVKSYYGMAMKNFGVNISNKGRSGWRLISSGLCFGFVDTFGCTPGMKTSMGKSLEWGWTNLGGVEWFYGPNSVSLGIGVLLRYYEMRNGTYFNKQPDGTITLQPFEEGISDGRSRIFNPTTQLPLLYRIKFGKQRCCAFSAGPVLNFNWGTSHIKTWCKQNDKEYAVTTHHISQRIVSVDLLGALTWEQIGIYARYSPMNVMRSSTGLEFKAVSVGVMLFM